MEGGRRLEQVVHRWWWRGSRLAPFWRRAGGPRVWNGVKERMTEMSMVCTSAWWLSVSGERVPEEPELRDDEGV